MDGLFKPFDFVENFEGEKNRECARDEEFVNRVLKREGEFVNNVGKAKAIYRVFVIESRTR